MTSVTLKAYAKINLTLDVIRRRPNGYHDVEMVMQQIDLCDVVTVTLNETAGEIRLTCSEAFLPTNDTNLAYRAAQLMKAHYGLEMGFDIHIEKNIPVAAGLAGGSTDAAAVMKAIKMLCLPDEAMAQVEALGLKIGADVPFCIRGGCAIARGLGEELETIDGLQHAWLVLVKPNFGVSTKEIYTHLDLSTVQKHPDTTAMVEAIRMQHKNRVIEQLGNVLETVTLVRYPEVARVKGLMASYGAEGVLMSGSGPTVFAFFKDLPRAKQALKKLKRTYHQSYLVTTYNGEISYKGE